MLDADEVDCCGVAAQADAEGSFAKGVADSLSGSNIMTVISTARCSLQNRAEDVM